MMNTIHICIAADKNYALPLQCLLNSIYKNCPEHNYVIHVLCSGFSEKYKSKTIKKYNGSNLAIDFKDMSNFDFDFHGLDMQHWTRAIFYRIMIPEIFSDLDRVLYIDGDTLVLGDLYELFNTEFTPETQMAMVVDRFSYRTRIPELHTTNYFNSGMILFDLKKCRIDNFSQKCIQWIHDNPEMAKFPDQDAINIVCDGKILRLNNMYNKQFATNDLIDLTKLPTIAHFLSAIKPWMRNAPIGYSKLYRTYMPRLINRISNYCAQTIYSSKYFIFHKKYAMKLEKTKVIEQVKYYFFNMCFFVKTLDNKKPDLLDILKNNQGAKRCQ